MNKSRLDELRMVDPVLTTIIQGYSNATMVGEKLFPVVKVSKLKGKIPVFGKEAFIVRDTLRAIRASSNRIAPSGFELVEFETSERDIETAIDYLEEEETHNSFMLEQKLSKDLMDILLLGREKAVADLVQNPDNYPEALVKSIEENQAWDNYSLSIDPLVFIRGAATAVRSRIALYPNTMIIGDTTYNTLLNHPKIIERVKYAGISKINTDVLKELTGIDNIYIGRAVFTEDANAFTDLWKDNIIIAYVDQSKDRNRSEYNASFGYTFQRENMPEIDSYFENGGKIKVIRCTDNYAIKICASDAAFLIENTNHNTN